MLRLKHFSLQIEIYAIAPINHLKKNNSLRLKFYSQSNARQVFAELSSSTVECCRHSSATKNGIFCELFWVFEPATKSWDLKRSSPALEMFRLHFNGALVENSDCCAYFDQIAVIVTEGLKKLIPRNAGEESDNVVVRATACITCNWENTFKIRGNNLKSFKRFL
jgi:hypothetical protein